MNKILITFVVVVIVLVIIAILVYKNESENQPLRLNHSSANLKANLNDYLFELYETENPLVYKFNLNNVNTQDEAYIYDLSNNQLIHTLDLSNQTLVLKNDMDKYLLENNGYYINLNKNNDLFTLQVNGIITKP